MQCLRKVEIICRQSYVSLDCFKMDQSMSKVFPEYLDALLSKCKIFINSKTVLIKLDDYGSFVAHLFKKKTRKLHPKSVYEYLQCDVEATITKDLSKDWGIIRVLSIDAYLKQWV